MTSCRDHPRSPPPADCAIGGIPLVLRGDSVAARIGNWGMFAAGQGTPIQTQPSDKLLPFFPIDRNASQGTQGSDGLLLRVLDRNCLQSAYRPEKRSPRYGNL